MRICLPVVRSHALYPSSHWRPQTIFWQPLSATADVVRIPVAGARSVVELLLLGKIRRRSTDSATKTSNSRWTGKLVASSSATRCSFSLSNLLMLGILLPEATRCNFSWSNLLPLGILLSQIVKYCGNSPQIPLQLIAFGSSLIIQRFSSPGK